MDEPMSAAVLRAAARRPDPPTRLVRAADAVADGRFSWEDAASGTCEHPRARALFSPRARQTVWPLLREVACELAATAEPAAPPPEDDEDDEDFGDRTYLE